MSTTPWKGFGILSWTTFRHPHLVTCIKLLKTSEKRTKAKQNVISKTLPSFVQVSLPFALRIFSYSWQVFKIIENVQ